jgi:hypothetical protein
MLMNHNPFCQSIKPLADLPDQARVWVFQSQKPLLLFEEAIRDTLQEFVDNWQSHGQPVLGAFELVEDHFLIVGALESEGVSGCSTDGLMRTVRQLGERIGCDLFDRHIAMRPYTGGVWEFRLLTEVRATNSENLSGLVLADLTLTQLGAFRLKWPVPVLDSWLRPKINMGLKGTQVF